jgi:crotonobetainyl-CoA:carnitine CoA-transferase CaiB-like acyl-CoA transferase
MEAVNPMSGVRIIELTAFGFVPSGVAILADWGADVVRIEHPRMADPMRGLIRAQNRSGATVDSLSDHFNRGKRNVAIDLGMPEGREVFYQLIRKADVFITSFLKPAQQKLQVAYEDLQPLNPQLIFAHGHGHGPKGPDANQPGFDGISYWARGGVGHALTFKGGPPAQQRGAFGDVIGGLSVATGVSAALYQRTVSGTGCAVDVSLLAVACWQLAPDILASAINHQDVQHDAPTADTGPFITADDRYVTVLLLMPHYLPNLLQALDLQHLLDDPRVTGFTGGVGASGLEPELRARIASLTASDIRARFQGKDLAWSIVQTPEEVIADPQVIANEYILPNPADPERYVVTPPVQFNQQPPKITSGAPAQGEHTEEVLREIGLDDQKIAHLHHAGAIAQGRQGDWDAYGRLVNGT